MKKITLSAIIIFCSLIINAQSKNNHGYLCLRGGPSFKDGSAKGIASVSVGMSKNGIIGIGAGLGYINFEKPYLPLTADISFFGKPGKVSPVIIGQAGYGVYNYATGYSVSRGGFTGSFSAGVGLPVKEKNKVIITVGGYTYGIITAAKINNGVVRKVSSKNNRIAVTFGLKI